jgi:hypothetical protein
MFSARNSFIAAFLLLMVAQAARACPSTYLNASSDGVNAYADASISDPAAQELVEATVLLYNPSSFVAGDSGSGVTYAEAHTSWPLDQDGDWLATGNYTEDGAPVPQRSFPFKIGRQQVSFLWNAAFDPDMWGCVYQSQCVPPPPNTSYCGPYSFTKPKRTPLVPECVNFIARRYRFFKQSVVGTTLTWWQIDGDMESQTNIPCDAPIP